MKILQVIDKLDVGGAERVFVDMCNILHQNNTNVTAFFLLDQGFLGSNLNNNIPKIELKRFQKYSLKQMYRCAKILKQYHLIHVHCRHVYKYIRIVDLIFGINKKIIFQDHYGSINVDKKAPYFLKTIFKPKYYIGVSETLTDWALSTLKTKPQVTFLLQNIVVRQKTYNNAFVQDYDFILVSNIKESKNQLFAVKIAAVMNKRLLLVGKIQSTDYYQKIQKVLNDKILVNHTINEVQPILNTAKLGLHTSISETGPLTLIEYLAQGLPFLSYETGEVAYMLKPYFPDYFIDNFDLDQWIKRIDLLLSQNPDHDKMRTVFEKHFSTKQYFEQLNAIYLCIKS